jgi:hypothetical protein
LEGLGNGHPIFFYSAAFKNDWGNVERMEEHDSLKRPNRRAFLTRRNKQYREDMSLKFFFKMTILCLPEKMTSYRIIWIASVV